MPGSASAAAAAPTPTAVPPDFLAGGGEVGAVLRATDWRGTPLGPPEGWPQPLRTALRVMLNTGHPMCVWWGPDLLCFHNDAFARSLGPERHPASLGKPWREVWAEVEPLVGDEVRRVLRGEGATWRENQLVPITRHGRREDAYWTYSHSPIDDPSAPNGVGGVLVVCAETTAQVLAGRRAEEALREREERLLLALDAGGGVGTWDWDVERDRVRGDAGFCRAYGVDPARGAAGAPLGEFVSAIHPDDAPAVGAAIAEALGRGGDFRAEYRVRGAEGEERWVLARGRALRDPATGRVARFPGVTVDVTERRRAEEALRAGEARARALLDAVPVGVVALDLQTLELRAFNPQVAEQLGYDPAEMEGMTLDRIDATRTREQLLARTAHVATLPPGTRYQVPARQRRRDGTVRDVLITNVRIDLDGRPTAFGAWHDVTERRAAEAALARSERRYRSFVEASAQVVWRMNAAGEVDEPMPAWRDFTGQGDAESRGMGWLDAVAPADRAAVREAWARAIASGGTYEVEYDLRRADGAWRRVLARGVPVREGDGAVVEWIGTCRDVTEQRAAEARVRAAEAQLARATDAAGVGVWELDLDGAGATRFNAAYLRLYGLPEGHPGPSFDDWVASVHPEDRARAAAAAREAVARRGEYRDEYRIVRPGTGEVRWVAARGFVVPAADGGPERFSGVNIDITERRAAEEALSRNEARLAMALEGTSDGLWDWDLATGEVYHSPRWVEMLGHRHEGWESTYENWLRHTHPDDVAGCEDTLRRYLAGETAEYRNLFRMRHTDGSWRWMLSRAKAYRDADGRVARMVGTHTDVTEQVEAEARLRAALDTAGLGTWERDLQTGESRWDARLAAMVGLPPERAAEGAARWWHWVRPEDRPLAEAASHPGEGKPTEVEYRVVPEDAASRGERVFSGRAVLAPGGGRVIGVVRDATEERRAAAALAASEARYRALFERMDAGFCVLEVKFDADSRPVDYRLAETNPAFERQTGLAGAAGRWVSEAVPGLERYWYDVYGGVALTGEAARFENYAAPFGRWYDVYAFRVGEPGERRVGVLFSDITARRRAEEELRRLNEGLERRVAEEVAAREAAQSRLAHAQRMEALGQLAGGVAHDFNNVLQAVQGGARLIEGASAQGDGARAARLARMVAEAAERGSSVTRRLLAFSRRGDLRTEAVPPGPLLLDLREVLGHTMGAGVGVRVDATPALPPVLADKGQLETVLVNLAANARDAMAGKGTIALGAAAETLARPLPPGEGHFAGLRAGRYVRLSVADAGAGMPPEVLARVTEPFFTTKGAGKGTGLGLAMARGFAEQSGGALAVESAPGRGTVVSLWLPVAPEAARRAGAAEGDAPPEGGGDAARASPPPRATVLVVDDEPVVREILAEGLRAAGHAVVACASGAEALALLDSGAAADLVVSDLSMPGMDGLELVAEVQRRRPRLPAILLTGFVTNAAELAVGGAVSGTFSLLRKPVSPEALAERAAVLLEGAAAAE